MSAGWELGYPVLFDQVLVLTSYYGFTKLDGCVLRIWGSREELEGCFWSAFEPTLKKPS